MHKYIKNIVLVILIVVFNTINAKTQLFNWSEANSPNRIGLLVAERFLKSPHGVYNAPLTIPHIPYFEVCNWYGALTFAQLSSNITLQAKLIDRFRYLIDKESSLLPVPDHVDYTVFGTIPLEIYRQTNDKSCLKLGKLYADKQWSEPEGPRADAASWNYYQNGYSWQTRLWIDDMYMITLIQTQAFRATGDSVYLNRTAREMKLYLDSLQKPNGLFFHAPDTPFYWGRGNGWMAAGMTELLRVLPQSNEYYQSILNGYLKMMTSLLKYQQSSGMWCQLVDDTSSWAETSCTGMFTFAIITGVKNGWLDRDTYGPAAMKGWNALIRYIDEKGDILNVCEGTGKKNDRQYYLDRKRITGDFHGQAPILWCASALLR